MDVSAIRQQLESKFGAAVGPLCEAPLGSWVEVDANSIDLVCRFLKSGREFDFDGLSNLSGVDYPERGHIQIVYNMFSYELAHELTLKVNADREAPKVKTVEGVWATANWLEREVYDLLGVEFLGHSDLRRILLPDDWQGRPLRKDYVEAPEYHGISTVRESILRIPGRE